MTIGWPGPGRPRPRSARGGAGPGRPGAYGNSRRTPTNPQGLVSTGPAIASEGLQVGVLVPTHGGLVGGLFVLVQDAHILEALGIVAPEIPQGFGGSLRGPLRIPRLHRLVGGAHAAAPWFAVR